ncbi:beta-1,3-galactosyltransferase 5-like [Nannospalax galili]|uniref:beta-1,3-galactosyltransferase 5-like n=1 Tax=Nannospalax galili TaxID=1026970 RepID=UPI0004ED6221|nr:beta-1,3-galactosyltransferase 5-like [Nannospalax galili]
MAAEGTCPPSLDIVTVLYVEWTGIVRNLRKSLSVEYKTPKMLMGTYGSHHSLSDTGGPGGEVPVTLALPIDSSISGQQVRTLFLLGASDSTDEMAATAQESQEHRDIIQKDFKDVYYNLTLKTMMGMEWVHHFCPQATFVMKTDSDMFVNVGYLTELLLRKNKTTRFFTGFLMINYVAIRSKFSKWFVSKFEYPWDRYPPFCSGTGYVLSTDVAKEVYRVSESIPFLKLEDVFVGLCLAKLKIRPEKLHSKQTFFPGGLRFSVCRFQKIVTCHYVTPHNLLNYWQALESNQEEDCAAV